MRQLAIAVMSVLLVLLVAAACSPFVVSASNEAQPDADGGARDADADGGAPDARPCLGRVDLTLDAFGSVYGDVRLDAGVLLATAVADDAGTGSARIQYDGPATVSSLELDYDVEVAGTPETNVELGCVVVVGHELGAYTEIYFRQETSDLTFGVYRHPEDDDAGGPAVKPVTMLRSDRTTTAHARLALAVADGHATGEERWAPATAQAFDAPLLHAIQGVVVDCGVHYAAFANASSTYAVKISGFTGHVCH